MFYYTRKSKFIPSDSREEIISRLVSFIIITFNYSLLPKIHLSQNDYNELPPLMTYQLLLVTTL